MSHFSASSARSFPLLSACQDAKPAASEPGTEFWHILQWGDHHLRTRRARWEALVGRERQGKRAAAPELFLSQTPAQELRTGLQIKEIQIVDASISDPNIKPQEGL